MNIQILLSSRRLLKITPQRVSERSPGASQRGAPLLSKSTEWSLCFEAYCKYFAGTPINLWNRVVIFYFLLS
jgi:hypothetical protein